MPAWARDVRFLRIAGQVAALAATAAVLAYLYDNVLANQRDLGIDSSFDFLDNAAGFRIAYSSFSPASSIWDAIAVGVRNTIAVALLGIVLTLIVGTLIGIGRLSSNWLVRSAAGAYVETLRNVPPLLVILFVNTVLLTSLPQITDPIDLGGTLLLTVREVAIMSPRDDGDAGLYVLILVAGALVALAVGHWRTRVEADTGKPAHQWTWRLGVFAAIAVGGYVALNAPVALSHPQVVGRSVEGGLAMGLPFVAVLVGLVLYTSSHVAEIVRGSIQAVQRGQVDAATAVGLSAPQRLRYVVLPQAFRIALPPIINQSLNLMKNTSLGVAVAYPEAVYVSKTVIGNGNPAIQSILLIMAVFLILSLIISVVGNMAIRQLKLVER